MTAVMQTHIQTDDRGRAWIAGTKVKVIEIVLDHIAYGFSPAEIHLQHPHLSLSQIHAALSYYYDHQADIDKEIQHQLDEADRLRAVNQDSPGRRRLRSKGMLP